MMDNRSAVESNFKEFGIEPGKDVLDKCEEICLAHNVSPEDLVESWMAYTVSKLNGAEPTLEYLGQFERKEYATTVNKEIISKSTTRRPATASPLVIYNVNATVDSVSEDLINTYCTTPKRKTYTKRHTDIDNATPEDRRSTKRQTSATESSRIAFSPASYSPTVATPSSAYNSRSNAGETVCSFGSVPAGASWKSRGPMESLQTTLSSKTPTLSADAKYMYEKLKYKSLALSDRIELIGNEIVRLNNLDSVKNFREQHVEPCVGFGRVCCDANGRLNSSSVLLEGSRVTSYGFTASMKLTSVPSYAMFPGQIVAVQGTNPTGDMVLAQKVFSSASPAFSDEPITLKASEGPLHVVVAAGPYTQMDNMTYQPLEDLMDYVKTNQPHVLILIGPFLDSNHQQVKENALAETFNEAFDKIINGVVKSLERLHTKVVIVSSARDAHHHPVYPTPPYEVNLEQLSNKNAGAVRKETKEQLTNVLFAPDPCLLDLSGVIIGVTSTDVVKHISKEEICNPPQGGDRIGRLASHLLSQRSFYPLYPSSEDVLLDIELAETFTELPVKPHILILPSDLRYYIKDVDGCVVVNPERLAKGMAGGTFARLEVKPVTDNQSLAKSTVAEVVRI